MNQPPPLPEDLRDTFAALSLSAVPRPDCPAPEAIWEAATGAAPAASAAAVVEHTSGCFACAEAWRLARAVADTAIAAPGSTGSAPSSGAFGGRTWILLAAAVVTVTAGLGVLTLRRSEAPVVMRAGEEVAIRSLVDESTPLARAHCVLKWSEPAPGARYTVRVGTEDLAPVAHVADLDRAEYTVPAQDLEKLPAGSVLVWRVEAVLPDGRRIDSPGFRNRLE